MVTSTKRHLRRHRRRWAAALAALGLTAAGIAWQGPTAVEALKAAARRVAGYSAARQRVASPPEAPFFGKLAVSQVGYSPRMRKQFSAPRPFRSFQVVRDLDGSVALRGGAPVREVHSDVLGQLRTAWIGDFTVLEAEGRYRIETDDGHSSYPFTVGTGVFDAAVRAVQRAFYYQRAFTAVEEPYAEGPWVHPSDAPLAPPKVSRGWHDAGDFSIYSASATTALFWLLSAQADFSPSEDDTNIPESGNGVPDLLDEARWGLEWMLSVQEPSGGFRNTTCQQHYGPYGTNRPERAGTYQAGEVGTIATGRAVGTLAFASTLFRRHDPAFAARCLQAARDGHRYLGAHSGEATDGPTCPVMRQDGNARAGREVRMYAAAGLLLATGESTYRAEFEENDEEVQNDPSFHRSNVYAALLYLRAPVGDPGRKEALRRQLRLQADQVRSDGDAHPFHWASRYFWGSIAAAFQRTNAFNAPACLADPVRAAADCEQALSNVHYALGRNSLALCYVSGLPGVTRGRTRAFHHWLAALDARPFLFPGLVAGGPAEHPEPSDVSVPHARPVAIWGYWGDPAMPRDTSTPLDGRYTDNDSWSTNELDVEWQGATLYGLYLARWWARGGAATPWSGPEIAWPGGPWR